MKTQVRWMYAKRSDQEWLGRIRFRKRSGTIAIPEFGTVSHREKPNGEIAIDSGNEVGRFAEYGDGEVLVRRHMFGVGRAIPQRTRTLLGRFIMVLVATSAFFRLYAARTSPNVAAVAGENSNESVAVVSEVKSEQSSEVIMSPTPIVIPEKITSPSTVEESTPKNKPKPKKKRRKKRGKRDNISAEEVKNIRNLFVEGDFEEASSQLEKIRKRRRGRLPKDLKALFAEVHYAICRREMERKVYPEAARECATAVRFSSHSRAEAVLRELGARARRLFLEGYVLEGTNVGEARVRYEQAVQSAPDGNAYGKKAARKLAAIRGVSGD